MRKLDLDELDNVSGGLDVRSLHNHLPNASGTSTDPFNHAYTSGGHVGPQYDPFLNGAGHFPVAPTPLQLHPTPALHPTTAPAVAAPAAAAANPLSSISAITGLINQLAHLGGSSSGGARAGGTPSASSGQSSAGHVAASHSSDPSSFTPSASHYSSGNSGSGNSNYHPTSAEPAATNNVPLPTARPDFEGQNQQAQLNQFTSQDAQNRATGYYGAFGDAPTGPSAASLNQFNAQDAQNRATGYYGAFGDAPTGPSAASLNQFNAQDNANRANGYYGAFGDPPTGTGTGTPGFENVAVPQYPTAAPNIDTTGVTPLYSDADLAANRAALGNYQDNASPVVSDPVPTNSGSGGNNFAVADASADQSYSDVSSDVA